MSKRKIKPLPRTSPQGMNKKAIIWVVAILGGIVILMTILLVINP